MVLAILLDKYLRPVVSDNTPNINIHEQPSWGWALRRFSFEFIGPSVAG